MWKYLTDCSRTIPCSTVCSQTQASIKHGKLILEVVGNVGRECVSACVHVHTLDGHRKLIVGGQKIYREDFFCQRKIISSRCMYRHSILSVEIVGVIMQLRRQSRPEIRIVQFIIHISMPVHVREACDALYETLAYIYRIEKTLV